MKFKILIVALVTVGIGGLLLARSQAPPIHDEATHPAHAVTVYKTPTCGCCAIYVNYLRSKNYDVEVVDMEAAELADKRTALGVPVSLTSCHTTVSKETGQFVEGHIPFEAVNQMLDEKPDAKGIGMPGMPSGSPGMPGSKTEPFNISLVDDQGIVTPYLNL